MAKRSYEQFCPLARSLDLIGERWTLLVIRDLFPGPKRYTDLREGLPGIATDILTSRLRDLEAAGLVHRRELPAPAASTVYELTPRGRELEPALIGLARFGFGLLDDAPGPDEVPTPDRLGLMLRVLFDPTAAPAEPEAYAFETAGVRIAVTVGPGGFEVHGTGEEADAPVAATIHGDATTIYELMIGRIEASAAIEATRLRIEGDAAAVLRMRAVFPPPVPVPEAVAA